MGRIFNFSPLFYLFFNQADYLFDICSRIRRGAPGTLTRLSLGGTRVCWGLFNRRWVVAIVARVVALLITSVVSRLTTWDWLRAILVVAGVVHPGGPVLVVIRPIRGRREVVRRVVSSLPLLISSARSEVKLPLFQFHIRSLWLLRCYFSFYRSNLCLKYIIINKGVQNSR